MLHTGYHLFFIYFTLDIYRHFFPHKPSKWLDRNFLENALVEFFKIVPSLRQLCQVRDSKIIPGGKLFGLM